MASIQCRYNGNSTTICNSTGSFSDIKVNGVSIGLTTTYNVSPNDDVVFVLKDGVYRIGNEFKQTTVTDVVIGNGVKGITSEAFKYCYYLTTIEIGKDVLYIVGDNVFERCDELRTINIRSPYIYVSGDDVFYKVKTEGFLHCPEGSDFTEWYNQGLDDSWYIVDDLVDTSEGSKVQCTFALKSKNLDGTTKLFTVGGYISDITVNGTSIGVVQSYALQDGDIVQYKLKHNAVGYNLFNGVNDIKTVVLSDNINYIAPFAFSNINYLEEVALSENLEYIDNQAFMGCKPTSTQTTNGFKTIYCKPLLVNAFYNAFQSVQTGGTIYRQEGATGINYISNDTMIDSNQYSLTYAYGWNYDTMDIDDMPDVEYFPEDDPTDPDNPDDPNDPNNPNKPNKRPVSGDLDYIGCSVENLEYNYTGGPSQYVDITWSDRLVGYSVGVSHSWIKVYSKPEILSDGTYRYHITCEENIDTNYRSGSISFAADDGSGTRYAISLPVYQLGAAVGVVSASTTSFKVNSDGSPEYSSDTHIKGFYTAVNILDPVVDGDWIHLGEGVEYGGVIYGYDKRIDYPISFDANDGETRTGAVTFRGTDANGNTLTCVCVVTQIGKTNEDEGDDPTDTPESSSDTTFSPIWKDVEYEFAGDTVYGLYVETYYRLPGNAGMQTVDNLIFKGRAYAAPDELTVKVNINKICQNYMTDHPDIFDGAVVYYHNFQKFKLKNEYGTLLHTYYFVGDWSYEELELGIKTNPITPFLGAGQRLFFSALAQEQKGIKWGMYYTDGTPEYHNTEYVTNELQTNVVVASRNKNVGTFYFGDKMYSVVPKCQCKYVIYYMNPYGGFDWFAVTGRVNRKDTLQTYSISQNYNNTTTGFGKKRYLSTINVNYEVNTQWLTEEQSDRMWELIESNCVWLHNLTTDKIIPVVITDTEVEHKQKTNSKRMLSYTINMEHSQTRERF